MTVYCLDSNFFITQWREYYSPDVVPDYWSLLEEYARENKIFVPTEIYEELEKGDDDLFKWLKKRKEIFVKSINEDIQSELVKIFSENSIKDLVDTKQKKSLPDPFVIAYAKSLKAVVVTDDRKLLSICKQMGVKCILGTEFVRENGITFSISSKNS